MDDASALGTARRLLWRIERLALDDLGDDELEELRRQIARAHDIVGGEMVRRAAGVES